MANQFIQKVGEVIAYKQTIFNDTIATAVWSIEPGSASGTLSGQVDNLSGTPATTQISFSALIPGMYVFNCVIVTATAQKFEPEIRVEVMRQGYK